MPEMNVAEVLTLAAKHAENGAAMESSACLCLSDALRWYMAHRYDLARDNAIRSLRYSVGIAHIDYLRATGMPVPAVMDQICRNTIA